MQSLEFVSPARAARTVGLDYRTFKRLIEGGQIKSVSISPTRRMINVADLLKWAASGVPAPATPEQ